MDDKAEARRGARIAASFWVGVEGIDVHPVLRRGNLSATGLFVESEQELGPAGSVQYLHLESDDRRVIVQVLARIIRVNQSDDVLQGRRIGTAIEFMPASTDGRQNLERLVRHVVELGLKRNESVEHHYEVGVGGHSTERTSLQRLSVQRVVLETDWRPPIGDLLHFDIRSPASGEHVPLAGQVTNVDPGEFGYRVTIRVTGLVSQRADTLEDNVGTAVTHLIADHVDDFALPPRDSLSGELARIKLPTLLSLFEIERMTGLLSISRQDRHTCTFFIQGGRLVDAEDSNGPIPVRETLQEIMMWKDGEFHFVMEDVDRVDALGVSTTGLLLDLAREDDEATLERELDSEDSDHF